MLADSLCFGPNQSQPPTQPTKQPTGRPQDLVQNEVAEIYGRESIAAVLPACYSRGLERATNKYTLARQRLEVGWVGVG